MKVIIWIHIIIVVQIINILMKILNNVKTLHHMVQLVVYKVNKNIVMNVVKNNLNLIMIVIYYLLMLKVMVNVVKEVINIILL